jgi:hypothetical protein
MNFVTDLDTPLLQLSPHDTFTLRAALEGTQIWGATGSGKTSGSGAAIAGAFLRAGFGGVVCCAKPEEIDLWKNYAKRHGRSDSLIIFDESQSFNFLDYLVARTGLRGIGTITECLMRILDFSDAVTRVTGTGNSGDAFWQDTARQILRYTIPLLYGVYGRVTVPDIIRFINSAATNVDLYRETNPDGSPNPQFQAFLARSFAAQTLCQRTTPPVLAADQHLLDAIGAYWFGQFPAIPEKTRGNILISISTRLDRFLHGRLRHAFCGGTTIVPEMCFHGAVIVLAMPTLTWQDDGLIAQQLFKLLFQEAVELRNSLDPSQRERPVFLWADESQYMVNARDESFLSTCRSSRACVVYLTQNLPAYYGRLGNDKTAVVDGLVGKFANQVFHQNACNRTNNFASDLIGRSVQMRRNSNETYGTSRNRGMNDGENYSEGVSSSSTVSGDGHGGTTTSFTSGTTSSVGANSGRTVGIGSNESESRGESETMEKIIEPNFFTNGLRSGGAQHGNKVTAIWFKVGARFNASEGAPYLLATFKQ